ncbi:MlaD family protein [Desulfocastanea catecholica]
MNQEHIARIIIFPLLLLLWGCGESSFNIQVRYDDVLGLIPDDPVYFEKNNIGKVQKVTYTQQGDYLVEITISSEFKNAVTVDSKFFIDLDPNEQQGKAVTILQEKPGGEVLEKGALVQGSVKTGFLDEMMNGIKRNATVIESEMRQAMIQLEKSLKSTSLKLDKEMVDALDNLSRQFQTFSNEMSQVPDSQEVKQLEESIKQFADEFHKTQKNVRDHLRDEVLPELSRQIDQLREQLREKGRDEEVEAMDKQLDEMNRI